MADEPGLQEHLDRRQGEPPPEDGRRAAADVRFGAEHEQLHSRVLVLSFFEDNTGLTRTLLGGWQIAGSAIFQTGNPINITRGGSFPTGDYNADGNGGDRPNTPASSVKTSGWSQEEFLAGIFKVSDFPVPAPGTNGNLVRNAYRGPGYADVSLSLSKKFALTPRVNTEIRVDAFNALNRVNLSDPVTDLANSNFGKVTSQLNTRAIQLGARVRF